MDRRIADHYHMVAVIATLNTEQQWRQASGMLSWLTCYLALALDCDVPILEAVYQSTPTRSNAEWKAQPLGKACVERLTRWCHYLDWELLSAWRSSQRHNAARRRLSHCVLDLVGPGELGQLLAQHASEFGWPFSPALVQRVEAAIARRCSMTLLEMQ